MAMPSYKIRVKKYDVTLFDGQSEPEFDKTDSYSRRIEATNVAEALQKGRAIVDELNAVKQVIELPAEDEMSPRKEWIEYRFELEAPMTPKHIT